MYIYSAHISTLLRIHRNAELASKSYNCDELGNLKFVNKAEIGLTCAAYKHSEEELYNI